MRGVLAVLVGSAALVCGAKSAEDPLVSLNDDNLLDGIAKHKLMLLLIGVEGCEPCAMQERMLIKAKKE